MLCQVWKALGWSNDLIGGLHEVHLCLWLEFKLGEAKETTSYLYIAHLIFPAAL